MFAKAFVKANYGVCIGNHSSLLYTAGTVYFLPPSLPPSSIMAEH